MAGQQTGFCGLASRGPKPTLGDLIASQTACVEVMHSRLVSAQASGNAASVKTAQWLLDAQRQSLAQYERLAEVYGAGKKYASLKNAEISAAMAGGQGA